MKVPFLIFAARFRPRLMLAGLCLLFTLMSSVRAWAQDRTTVEPGVAVHRRAYPALVKIEAHTGKAVPSRGSGFVCSPDGRIVTNYHVIRRASHVRVYHLKYDKDYEADVVAVDPRRDIALLQVRNFAGFQWENDRKDPDAKPLRLRSGSPPDGVKVFAVTNPVNLLGIITEGLARNSLIRVPLRNRGGENYEVLIFSAQVTHGSSGGPVLDAAGEVVGITTGAAGVENGRYFGAFAVPSRYLAELVAASRTLGALAPAQFGWANNERGIPDDGYYASPLLAENQQPPETQVVSGVVFDEASLPVQGALVHAVGRYPENLQLHTEPAETTEAGAYRLVLPQLPGGSWTFTVRHLAYQDGSAERTELPATPLDLQVRLRDHLVQDAPVFQASPLTLALGRQDGTIRLRSYVRSRKGLQNRPLDWRLNTDLLPGWVEVAPRNGRVIGGAQVVTLRYVGTGSEPPGELGQIGFLGGNQVTGGEELAIDVYADTIPDSSPLWIYGYVSVVSGGAPRENIVVQAYVGETLVRDTQTDNSGFFRLDFPSKYSNQFVRLKVEGQRWRAVSPEGLSVRLDGEENERIIPVVAK